MAAASNEAGGGAQSPPRKPKGPSVREKPELRQHPSHFYSNFVSRGVTHDMANKRQLALDSVVPEAEINRRKCYSIGEQPHAQPPYHIAGDDERVRDSGTYCRVRGLLTAKLVEADTNQDGCVSYKELGAVLHAVVDPHLPDRQIEGLCRLLDPDRTGKIPVAEAVATSLRTLATRPSQRSTVGAGNPLAWAADTDSVRDPNAVRAAALGGSLRSAEYYGITGGEIVAASPQREALLPGLSPRVAGLSSSARLRDVDSRGGTAAPLLGGGSATPAGSSPRSPAARNQTAPPSPRGQRTATAGGGSSPRGGLQQHVSSASFPATRPNRTSSFRQQWIAAEAAEGERRRAAERHGDSHAHFPRFSTPKGASHAPRPGLHIVVANNTHGAGAVPPPPPLAAGVVGAAA